jgi:hypothetical protein
MADKLHYSMAEVEKDYAATYSMFMKAAAIGIVGAIVYFFVLAIFLGGWGHTHSDDFVRTFAADGRIEAEYAGTKLPMFENPALVAFPEETPPEAVAGIPVPVMPVANAAVPVLPTPAPTTMPVGQPSVAPAPAAAH